MHIEVSIDDQRLRLFHQDELVQDYPISTAAKGAGTQEGSFRTPVGRFRVAEMIGNEASPDAIFRGRVECGIWDHCESHHDLILARIIWLDGTDAGNANTHDRYIYIHGTNHLSKLGTPASCGCIRMSSEHVIELFSLIEPGIPVTIHPPTAKGGKLIFFDCDSTLSTIEGVDELARARGPEVFAKVEALTHAAMNGEIPIQEVFPRRMEVIHPDQALCDEVAQQYIDTITPGTTEAMAALREQGWTPVILSGGFAPLIKPLATHLGIEHVEAVPLQLDDEGIYVGFDDTYPTTRNGGKPDVIREWKDALLPTATVMVGDGISDLESRRETDLFVGYGGVIRRDAVKEKADLWIEDMSSLAELLQSHFPKL